LIYIYILPPSKTQIKKLGLDTAVKETKEMREASREGERKSQRDIFFIKKIDWEATVLPNTFGSTVATQPKNVNLRYLLWGGFCEFW
jgi:hypothetical protein